MSCSQVQHIIDEIGDLDRLPPETSRHVAACARCARFGRELIALRALLREPGRVAAPPDFDARLAERLAARPATVAPRAWVYQRPLAAAASVAILLSGAVALSRLTAPERPGTVAVDESVPNEPAPHRPPDAGLPVPPDPAVSPSSRAAVESTRAASPPSHAARAVSARAARHEAPAAPTEVMFFVRDTAGSRVVSVPEVLVGAQTIVVPDENSLLDSAEARSRASF